MSAFFFSLTAFSLVCSVWAQDDVSDEEFVELTIEEKTQERVVFPRKTQEEAAAPAAEAPKKIKPHFAGVKRKDPNAPPKQSRKIKNPWFSSKTQPKPDKRQVVVEEEEAELPDDRPHFIRTSHIINAPLSVQSVEVREVSSEPTEEFPRTGLRAPDGHVYLTGEWLYWRARQEGMEFATTKNIGFEFQSGFRVGVGVHLPCSDKWEVAATYTYYWPKASNTFEGGFYPLFLFQGAGISGSTVTYAQGHWVIGFQTLDLAFGKSYYLTPRLIMSPFFGIKGAWIKQHAHFHYRGGFIPADQTFRTHFENDFKGAGPLLGTEINWQLGSGFSFFGTGSTAFAVGQFCNEQNQYQLDDANVVHLDNDINLVSPMLQMIAGIGWDRNFHQDRCHLGLSASFETQYWWSQNQTEQFTDDVFPIYVRQKGNLGLYGLTLNVRVDF